MAEVVARRFARLAADPGSDDWDESFTQVPNLVVIDGGKGQLSAALAAMQAYDLPRVAVIALAKRVEEVFVPGRAEPIRLDRSSPALQLLQRIRDEAHRFAVGFHRQRRDARARESLFDRLEGVGPARRRALLRHFGSTEQVVAATPGGARGRARPAREDGALDLRAAAQDGPGVIDEEAAGSPDRARSSASSDSATSGRTSSATPSRRAAPGSRTSPRRCSSTA